jgi:CRP-like cAMP-binding protein
MKNISMQEENNLFKCIPPEEWGRIAPHILPISLNIGAVLYESGDEMNNVYFPSTAVVSLFHELESGSSTEIAIVGSEGLVGISTFMGGDSCLSRAVAQSSGEAYMIKSNLLLQEFNSSLAVMHLFLRYTQALISQISQTAVCNRHHTLEQRFCRWLLLSLDRHKSNNIFMTHELIAEILGVRRQGVSQSALNIQKAGFIIYFRGQITVLNRQGLESRACECYQVVKKEYARLLPNITSS